MTHGSHLALQRWELSNCGRGYRFAQLSFYGGKNFMQKNLDAKEREWPRKSGRICVWQSCSVADLFISLCIYYFVTLSVCLLFNVFIG